MTSNGCHYTSSHRRLNYLKSLRLTFTYQQTTRLYEIPSRCPNDICNMYLNYSFLQVSHAVIRMERRQQQWIDKHINIHKGNGVTMHDYSQKCWINIEWLYSILSYCAPLLPIKNLPTIWPNNGWGQRLFHCPSNEIANILQTLWYDLSIGKVWLLAETGCA